MKYILIVEDDPVLREGLCRTLAAEDWRTAGAKSIGEARVKMAGTLPDCLVLDCNLPDGNGFDFCREVVSSRPVPVLFLTVRDSEADEVAAFQAGAYDYMKKPFSLMVLKERVRRLLLTGSGGNPSAAYVSGRYAFYFDTLDFRAEGEPVILSASEARLLSVLVKNAGRVVSRSSLIEALWDCSADAIGENTLSVTVKRLRGKLSSGKSDCDPIRTVYGLGYVWKGDES